MAVGIGLEDPEQAAQAPLLQDSEARSGTVHPAIPSVYGRSLVT